MDEIHFLANELEYNLNRELEKLVYALGHPHAHRNLGVLQSFLKNVIFAQAQRTHHVVPPIISQSTSSVSPDELLEQSLNQLRQKILPSTQQTGSFALHGAPAGYYQSVLTPEQPPVSANENISSNDDKKVLVLQLVSDFETGQLLSKAEVSDDYYYVYEPEMSEHEWKLFYQMKKDVQSQPGILQDKKTLIKQMIKSAKAIDSDFNEDDYLKFRYYLVRDLFGYGVAESLLHDKSVERVVCEGPGEPLMVIRSGKKIKTNLYFKTKEDVNEIVAMLAEKTYQHLSIEDPVLDVTYRGFRIQGTLGADLVPTRFIMTRLTT